MGAAHAAGQTMPRNLETLTEPDRPVTRRELREELDAVLQTLATKEDLKAFATKEELKAFATKEELKAFADDIKGHFNAVTEHFKSEFFDKLHDWTHGNVEGLSSRVSFVERDHGDRLLDLDTRVTALETRPRQK